MNRFLLKVIAAPAVMLCAVPAYAQTRQDAPGCIAGVVCYASSIVLGGDAILSRDAANTLALRNGTAAQQINVYQTYTDASNYNRLELAYDSGTGNWGIGSRSAGTGGSVGLEFFTNGTTRWLINTSGLLQAGGTTSSFPALKRSGAVISVRLADDSDNAGLVAGYLRSVPLTVATLPAAATAGAGSRSFVTDGSTTVVLGLGLTVVGGGSNKVPVYSDGVNWIVG